jgi:hypothetical protein
VIDLQIRLLVTDLSQLLNNRKLDPGLRQALSTQRSGIACWTYGRSRQSSHRV